jgi:hypothetical protein
MRVAARTAVAEDPLTPTTSTTTSTINESVHEAALVVEPPSKTTTSISLNPDQLLEALKAKGIKYEIRDNLVTAAPSFGDSDGRNFVKSLNFKWDSKTKEWTKFL